MRPGLAPALWASPASPAPSDSPAGSHLLPTRRSPGGGVAAAGKNSSATRWNAAPFALGAMSSAAPGAQPSRKILAEPIGCMFVAGEATHETLWGTVDGAWESGGRAADAALRRIGDREGPRRNSSH